MDEDMVVVMHQLRNYVTAFLGGVETGKLELAHVALEQAKEVLYELRYREVLRLQ